MLLKIYKITKAFVFIIPFMAYPDVLDKCFSVITKLDSESGLRLKLSITQSYYSVFKMFLIWIFIFIPITFILKRIELKVRNIWMKRLSFLPVFYPLAISIWGHIPYNSNSSSVCNEYNILMESEVEYYPILIINSLLISIVPIFLSLSWGKFLTANK